LPVSLTTEQVVTVEPDARRRVSQQGLAAGIAGLIALALYLLFYYRLLALVAWFGMAIWAVLALALISLAGVTIGYTLTLAGVAGLVISLGVTADSYIVFFERLKDEVRNGRSPRAAVQPAFKRAYKTIVAADIVTALAAVVLYVTAISSVRGFALTLGVATALDLFVVYFFKRPTVFLIARSERLVGCTGSGSPARRRRCAPEPAIAGGSDERAARARHVPGYRTPRFQIIEHRRWWAIVSGTLLALSVLGLVLNGLNFSIDFTGGSLISTGTPPASPSRRCGVLADYGARRPRSRSSPAIRSRSARRR
jgi:preprotein translocase subunit SecD